MIKPSLLVTMKMWDISFDYMLIRASYTLLLYAIIP